MTIPRGPYYYSTDRLRRYPILVPLSGSAGPHDVKVVIPPKGDYMWNALTSGSPDGEDLTIKGPNGYDDTTCKRTGAGESGNLTISSEAGEIYVDDYTWTGASSPDHGVLWAYWKMSSPTDEAGSFTSTSPVTGEFAVLAKPADAPTFSSRIDTVSRQRDLEKDPGEEIYVWFRVDEHLGKRAHAYSNLRLGVGIQWLSYAVTRGGSAEATMKDVNNTVYVVDGKTGEHYIGVTVKAGTAGWHTMCELTLGLTDNQTIILAAEVRVKNIVESPE